MSVHIDPRSMGRAWRAGAVTAAVLAAALVWGAGATSAGHQSGVAMRGGTRTWRLGPSEHQKRGELMLRLDRRWEGNHWGESFPVDLAELHGLDANARGDVSFELRRDAGTITFEGEMSGRRGQGTFDVVPDRGYLGDLARLGHRLDDDQAYAAVVHDIHRDFVRDVVELGYRTLDWDHLVSFRIHGVTPEFIRRVNSGKATPASVDRLVDMRIHGREQ